LKKSLTSHPYFGRVWMNRRYGGWFLTSVSGVVLSARNRNGQRHLFQKKSKARFPFCLQSKSKGGEVMVTEQKDILGILVPESNVILCKHCCPPQVEIHLLDGILLTREKTEGNLLFCFDCDMPLTGEC
jgi:hypothetical protein